MLVVGGGWGLEKLRARRGGAVLPPFSAPGSALRSDSRLSLTRFLAHLLLRSISSARQQDLLIDCSLTASVNSESASSSLRFVSDGDKPAP